MGGLRSGSLAVKIKPGANLGVLDSTRVLGLTKDQARVLDLTKVQTRALDLTKDLGSIKDQAQDSAVEVQTQTSTRAPVQATTKAQVDLMATQPLPHPVLMLSSAQVPSMEIMTILHPLDVAAGDVVAQLGVGVVDVVVGRWSKALEVSNQEKVVVMEERSAMCPKFLSKAADIKSYEYSCRFDRLLEINNPHVK